MTLSFLSEEVDLSPIGSLNTKNKESVKNILKFAIILMSIVLIALHGEVGVQSAFFHIFHNSVQTIRVRSPLFSVNEV